MSEDIGTHRSPVCSAVGFFMGSTAVLVLIAAGLSSGLVAVEFGRRGIYVVLGVLMVLVGNALPKLRPFARWRADARRLELFAGGAIMVAGLTWILGFVLTPAAWANWMALTGSASALLVIAACLFQLLHQTSPRHAPVGVSSIKLDRRARLTFWLLATFLYLLIVATAKLLGESLRFDASSWAAWGFGAVYAVLFVILERRRSC